MTHFKGEARTGIPADSLLRGVYYLDFATDTTLTRIFSGEHALLTEPMRSQGWFFSTGQWYCFASDFEPLTFKWFFHESFRHSITPSTHCSDPGRYLDGLYARMGC
jgi:hypothetical protein